MMCIRLRMACCVLAGLVCIPAQAAEPSPEFEITPFAGLRLGGNFDLDESEGKVDLDPSGVFALALGWRMDEVSQYELFYGRQSTNLEEGSPIGDAGVDVEYLHLGGLAAMQSERRVQPYIVGGLGATRLSPKVANAGDETRFSISLGAGLRVPFSERFSLRLEGRGYVTLVDSDSALFCRSDEEGGACLLRGSGSTFIQYELLAGAAFAF